MTQEIIHEASASQTLEGQQTNTFFHSPAPNDPILNVNNIQGNILGGFNKDYQALLFLEIENPNAFKHWLESQIKFIATASEVIAFNRLFKSSKERRGREGTVKATWVNIAFSFEGLKKLTNDADTFTDTSFKAGLAARAVDLNDPVDKDGKPIGWVVGGPDNGKVDLVFIIASDDRADLLAEVSRILESIVVFTDDQNNVKSSGARITFLEEGANLPAPLSGHEHFGNKDGISQPGIRGRLSDNPKELLTPRQNPENQNQGKPGQDVLWPGEFVFGYEGQNDDAKTLEDSKGEVVSAGLHWANDGSYLVFRRLRQDVYKFHHFLNEKAANLNTDPQKVSAKLIGRWPSGAPTVRTPEKDAPKLGDDDNANNDFEFNGDDPLKDHFFRNDVVPPSKDATGLRCPFIAHTRKTYPRNDKTPGGGGPGPEEIDRSEVTTQTHRLLRRGIPYGPVSASTPNNPLKDKKFVDRGLHFLAYQTSIVDQFEFVTKFWANNPEFSKEAATGHEFKGELTLGHDPIIGQSKNNKPNGDRTREFYVHLEDDQGKPRTKKLTAPEDWVIPTGGGYFFAPSISALKEVLTK
ncbi:MAG: Dyp-type peroxidase [Nostoc sp.]|uniref:Dyp-type peroxidase n=1 Tax=unclassified Nostoc TaxID=2593658 RepID=UPI001DED6067|nr:Dyp-type peroxidase [Nostoc sp. JL34]MBN3886458.1 Dyp-type peroxidase [Nostoc sp. JL34]